MKDDWIAAALIDDTVVVDMLLRLKQSQLLQTSDACVPATNKMYPCLSLPPLNWGSRQPRSKPSTASIQKWPRCVATAARSPTTPLSWSGGSASPSDAGCDESSRPPSSSSDLSSAFRSKCIVTKEIKTISCSGQGSKRKKEVATVHVNLNQQRAMCENLKKIKVDLNQESENDTALRPHVQEEKRTNRCFILPDLNMDPTEEEIGSPWN